MESEITIRELIKVIVMQEKEIDELKSRLDRVKQYIEVYEECLRKAEK